VKATLLTCGLLVCQSCVGLADEAQAKSDNDALQDTWELVAFEKDGEKSKEKKELEGARLVISEDKMEMHITKLNLLGFAVAEWLNPPKNEHDALKIDFRFKTDVAKKPKLIDLTNTGPEKKERVLQGIYSLRGDKLKICLDLGGKSRPTKFVTKKDDKLIILYLERE
jgi:uncharacterized protein (TIGR03067 family)